MLDPIQLLQHMLPHGVYGGGRRGAPKYLNEKRRCQLPFILPQPRDRSGSLGAIAVLGLGGRGREKDLLLQGITSASSSFLLILGILLPWQQATCLLPLLWAPGASA